jgi:hypothetical protein
MPRNRGFGIFGLQPRREADIILTTCNYNAVWVCSSLPPVVRVSPLLLTQFQSFATQVRLLNMRAPLKTHCMLSPIYLENHPHTYKLLLP